MSNIGAYNSASEGLLQVMLSILRATAYRIISLQHVYKSVTEPHRQVHAKIDALPGRTDTICIWEEYSKLTHGFAFQILLFLKLKEQQQI